MFRKSNSTFPFSASLYNIPGVRFAADDPGNGQQVAGKPDANGSGNPGPSQEELNRQFAERAKRAEEAERKRLLESLGVQSEDDLKAIVQAKKQAEEAAKSELQKLADKTTAAEAKAAKLEAEAAEKIAAMQKRLLDSEIKQLAGRAVEKDGKTLRAAFRVEALDDILLLIDRAEIKDEDGKYTGIDKALEALAKTKPYLLAETQSAQNQPKGTPPPAARKPMAQQAQQGNEPARVIPTL